MNLFKVTSLFLFAALCCVGFSCTKNKDDQSELGMLEHTWKLTANATDDNGNGVIDPSEIHAIQPPTLLDELTFKNDGTGTDYNSLSAQTLNFSWTLSNDSLTRKSTAHDTIVYIVANLNSSNMELTTKNDSSGIVAYFYTVK